MKSMKSTKNYISDGDIDTNMEIPDILNKTEIPDILNKIGICEEILEQYPKDSLHNRCFLAYQSDILMDYPDFMFRNHCIEISSRLSKITDKTPQKDIKLIMESPTCAEIVTIYAGYCRKTPIRFEHMKCLQYLFAKILHEENQRLPYPFDDIDIQDAPHEQLLDEFYSDCLYSNKTRSKVVIDQKV